MHSSDVKMALKLLREHSIAASLNILVGIPFLTISETIDDSLNSLTWAFSNGASRCVLFPVNTKPFTLVDWLEQNGLYRRPSLWSLVEVLASVNPDLLPRIEISWFRPRPQRHPKYTTPNLGPSTCPNCYAEVTTLLDQYAFGLHRDTVIRSLYRIECACKDAWRDEMALTNNMALAARVEKGYKEIGTRILGEDWWLTNGTQVLNELSMHSGFPQEHAG